MNRLPMFIFMPVAFAIASLSCQDKSGTGQLVNKAREIHQRVLTIDSHDDIPFDFATAEVDPGVWGERKVDIPKMQKGGLDAGFFIVYVGQTERNEQNYKKAKIDAMTKFDAIKRMCDMYPESIELAFTADDVKRIHRSGKLVACIGIENGYVIGRDLGLLQKYHELGARYITLAHNGHNDICDSANPRSHLGDAESEHNGVSEFGKQVIQEMNRLGIMVDVSHISKKSMLDAVRLSKAPAIASHSNARAVCDVSRNMDDEQLLALKQNGGVLQTVALGAYIKDAPLQQQTALDSLHLAFGMTSRQSFRLLPEEQKVAYRKQRQKIRNRWPITVADFVDHIDYTVELIGIDHVGISSDFDGGGGISGWNDASETFNVTLELVQRGYSEEDIAKLWGGNLLRVWRAVESVALELRSQE